MLTFDRLSSVFLSNTNHEEDQPVHLRVADMKLEKTSEHDVFAGPSARYCPAGVYEWVEEGGAAQIRHQRAELRPLQNLRHQGPESEHHLGSTRRRRRTELSEYVIAPGGSATMPPHRAFKLAGSRALPPFLRAPHKKAILGSTHGGTRAKSQLTASNGAPPVTSSSFARCLVGTALAAFLVAPADRNCPRRLRRTQDLAGMTATGSYLAARHAGQERDAAAAAAFYRSALRRDPRNGELLDRTFLSLLVDGEIDEVGPLRRAHRPGRQERPRRPAGAGRACAQEKAICRRAPRTRAVGARADHRSHRDAARRLEPARRRATARARSRRSTGSPGRNGTRSSRICMPA